MTGKGPTVKPIDQNAPVTLEEALHVLAHLTRVASESEAEFRRPPQTDKERVTVWLRLRAAEFCHRELTVLDWIKTRLKEGGPGDD